MENFKISKTDYLKQKEMLEPNIGKTILIKYKLLSFLDITLEEFDNGGYISSYHNIKCVIEDKEHNIFLIPINIIFLLEFPQYCKDWSELPTFNTMFI